MASTIGYPFITTFLIIVNHMLSCRAYVGCNIADRQDAEKYNYGEPDTDFATELFDLIEASNVSYWIFGHSHEVVPDF